MYNYRNLFVDMKYLETPVTLGDGKTRRRCLGLGEVANGKKWKVKTGEDGLYKARLLSLHQVDVTTSIFEQNS